MKFDFSNVAVCIIFIGLLNGCAESSSKAKNRAPLPNGTDPAITGSSAAVGNAANVEERTLVKSDCTKSPELYACGPFSTEFRLLCEKAGGGKACLSDRWSKSLYDSILAKVAVEAPKPIQKPDANTATASQTLNAKLHGWYTSKANYDTVLPEVLTFYEGGRKDGCVAFISTAMRAVGIPVPKIGQREGYQISLVTSALSIFLENDLKWTRITSHNDLLPGDVVFSVDAAQYPGFPAHVYMFHKWSDKAGGIGEVVDNQDFIHKRNIFGYNTFNFSPFRYALRSPK